MTTSFIKANTATRWYKLPTHRLNVPEYFDRAILESVVNHLIHRDYVVIGSELHMDIYDDRMELYTPGGMYDGGKPIQDRDINTIPSIRRNPVIADVFAQLDYMEKRGSSLKKMQNLESTLPSYNGIPTPTFRSDNHAFFTTFRNMNYGLSDADFLVLVGDHGEGVMGEGMPSDERFTKKKSPKTSPEISPEASPEISLKTIGKPISKTGQAVLDIIISDIRSSKHSRRHCYANMKNISNGEDAARCLTENGHYSPHRSKQRWILESFESIQEIDSHTNIVDKVNV